MKKYSQNLNKYQDKCHEEVSLNYKEVFVWSLQITEKVCENVDLTHNAFWWAFTKNTRKQIYDQKKM